MSKEIEPKLSYIQDYLSVGKKEMFVIPEYQRGYSWTLEQCAKLFEDIENFIESDDEDPYFFGTVIIDSSIDYQHTLIDGQQRTTTFLLLLKALLLNLNDKITNMPRDTDSEALLAGLSTRRNKILEILFHVEPEDVPAYLRGESDERKILIENRSINELFKNELVTILNGNSYEEIMENVHTFPRKKFDNKYTNFFRNFKYFYTMVQGFKSDGELNKFARGFLEKCQVIRIKSWHIEQAITMFNSLNSTGMPLSDTDIISAKLYANAGDENRSEFNEKWNELKVLTDNLSDHGISNLNDVLKTYMYSHKSQSSNLSEAKSVTLQSVRKYFTVSHNELLSDPIDFTDKLMVIANSWDKNIDNPLNRLALKYNENIRVFLAQYRFIRPEVSQGEEVSYTESLIKLFTLLELSDLSYSTQAFKGFLFDLNIKINNPAVSTNELNKDIDTHIQSRFKRSEYLERLKEYRGNLLVYLTEYVLAKKNNVPFKLSDSIDIEHIMPQSSKHKESVMNQSDILNEVEFAEYVNKLGNKTLLEAEINRAISDNWFVDKKSHKISDRAGYIDSIYQIPKYLSTYQSDKWGKASIDKQTDYLSNEIANFIFGTELSTEEKAKLYDEMNK